jgi:hypothetical protein
MGSLGPRCRGRGPASRRGRGLSGAGHPALQGAWGGQVVEVGLELAKLDEQIGRPPGGVLLVQEQGLLDGQRRTAWCGGVSGPQGAGPVQAELPAEVSDGAWAEAQGAGNGGRRQSASPELVNPLP